MYLCLFRLNKINKYINFSVISCDEKLQQNDLRTPYSKFPTVRTPQGSRTLPDNN